MAEAPVPILPNVLVAVLPAAEAAAEVPAPGDNPIAPADTRHENKLVRRPTP